jgi:hypothetical protein
MRKVIEPQMTLGEVGIPNIELDPKSRDDIPQILRGLKFIFVTASVFARVFEILQTILPDGVSGKANPDVGRPGMNQWTILVLGTLRLGLNADYDRIHELANQHFTIRQMLGHSDWADAKHYELQTIKDNLQLFTPEILAQINQVVVEAGHEVIAQNEGENGKKEEGKGEGNDKLHVRVDSFVVETDVEYPTDLNLLQTAMQKVIKLCAILCGAYGLSEWRQSGYLGRQFKKAYTAILRLRPSPSKNEEKKEARQAEIEQAYSNHLEKAEQLLERARGTREKLLNEYNVNPSKISELDEFIAHVERQIDQIRRRVLQNETIPHKEKVFSLHEPHTEWIVKGKAGVPVELGLRVAVVEDQNGFILNHEVMENTTDVDVAVPIIQETKKLFPNLSSSSFDKGFHSPENQKELGEVLDRVILPKKGKLSAADKERENAPEFVEARRQHPAVESAINALEVHGLDRCPDHGIDGFKRYVALAILARNIQLLGVILHRQEQEKEKRKRRREPYRKAA